jgi:transcriptional regulator with XRE-family HTH domain
MSGKKRNADAEERPIPRNYIREWRRFRDRMTLQRLAEKADLAESTISDAEKRVHDVTGRTLLDLSKALDTTPGALLDVNPLTQTGKILAVWSNIRPERQPQALTVLQTFEDEPSFKKP